jgi:short-subunit dehydrogenase involved in D-alanine esterification of teichoic acids
MESTNLKVFEIIPPIVETPMTEGRGKNKISAEQLVKEFIRDFKNDREEIYVGKSKLLKLISRISPKLADKILKNG